MKREIFIIGCKGIPSNYGGYETFVDKLTEYHENNEKLHYNVACKNAKETEFVFVGTVYNQPLLKKIREDAFAYFHGHEVGGTNPSLLEALGSTKLNLLLNVGFNREVGEDGASYWTKEAGNLATLINNMDNISEEEVEELSKKAKDRINNYYSWNFIANEYQNIWAK